MNLFLDQIIGFPTNSLTQYMKDLKVSYISQLIFQCYQIFTVVYHCNVIKYLLLSILRKKCPYSELFWSVFSRILTEYGPE